VANGFDTSLSAAHAYLLIPRGDERNECREDRDRGEQ
jgi:hypothetical protein